MSHRAKATEEDVILIRELWDDNKEVKNEIRAKEQQILEIRREINKLNKEIKGLKKSWRRITLREIASKFGLHVTTVYYIVSRQTWNKING